MTASAFGKLSPRGGRYRAPPPGARISIQALLGLSALIVLVTSVASSTAHSTSLMSQSQEPIQRSGVIVLPSPPSNTPAEGLVDALAHLPGYVPPLNTSDTDAFRAACPTHLSDWRVAHNPRGGGYDLVTYGPGEFISDVCLRGGESIFWEERMSNFILGLLRASSAPASGNASSSAGGGGGPSLMATMPWFLDIGSNIGVHTVAVARAGFPVVAIDANPTAVARLRCSLALNAFTHVTLLNLALGLSPTLPLGGAANNTPTPPPPPAFMCLKVQDPKNVGQNHLIPCTGGRDDSSAQQQQQQYPPIPLVSLDNLLLLQQQQQQQQQQAHSQALPSPSLIIPTPPTVVKMDVEGFEWWVVQGGREWLGRVQPPFILMEINPHLVERAGGDWRGILDFWLGLGYHVFSVGGGGLGGREITREDYLGEAAGKALMEANSHVARCNFDFVFKQTPGGDDWPGGWPERLCFSE